MIKIHSNIIIGNLSDLQQLINNVTYIINCSPNFAKLCSHPNYLNLNINNPIHETLNILNQISDFMYNKIMSNQNIFLLCDTGINNSLIVGMFFLMKFFNINYQSVYHNITLFSKINPYEFYLGLAQFEPYILKSSCENMDLS